MRAGEIREMILEDEHLSSLAELTKADVQDDLEIHWSFRDKMAEVP